MSNETAAEILFGTGTPTPDPTPAPTPASSTPHRSAADVLFDDGTLVAQQAIDAKRDEMFEKLGATAAQHEEIRNTFSTIQRSTKLPPRVVAQIAEGYIQAEIDATHAPDPEAHAAKLAAQTSTHNDALRAKLCDRYGPEEAEALIVRTQQFVNANPALSKILGQHGLGSKPEIFEGIVSYVFSSGLRGR